MMQQDQAMFDDESLMDFMKTHKPDAKHSKLEKFEKHIFFLKKQGYSDASIVLFLKEKKSIEISRSGLRKFMKTRSAITTTNTTQSRTVANTKPCFRQTGAKSIKNQNPKQAIKNEKKNGFTLVKMSDEEAKEWLS